MSYLADGTKLAAVQSSSQSGYSYAGPFRYYVDSDGMELESVGFSDGRFLKDGTSFVPQYYMKDHLGSVRAVADDNGEIVVAYDYLPYGTLFNDTAPQLGNNRYLYGGKELQEGLGVSWYDSGARFQTMNGVFTGIDPLAEKYYGISPYAYCAGNPVMYVDPDGKKIFASDRQSKRNIRNTIHRNDMKYIKFSLSGKLKTQPLNRYQGESNNMHVLKELANSDINYVFKSSDTYESNGKEIALQALNNDNSYGEQVQGVTLMPDAKNDPSPDGNVHIITFSGCSDMEQALNVAHEAYGHAYLFELKQQGYDVNPNHTYESNSVGQEWVDYLNTYVYINGRVDTNENLIDRIRTAQDEVLVNMDSK